MIISSYDKGYLCLELIVALIITSIILAISGNLIKTFTIFKNRFFDNSRLSYEKEFFVSIFEKDFNFSDKIIIYKDNIVFYSKDLETKELNYSIYRYSGNKVYRIATNRSREFTDEELAIFINRRNIGRNLVSDNVDKFDLNTENNFMLLEVSYMGGDSLRRKYNLENKVIYCGE